jgi:hypothetical protein
MANGEKDVVSPQSVCVASFTLTVMSTQTPLT